MSDITKFHRRRDNEQKECQPMSFIVKYSKVIDKS